MGHSAPGLQKMRRVALIGGGTGITPLYQVGSGTLKRVVWYFEEGDVVLCRG